MSAPDIEAILAERLAPLVALLDDTDRRVAEANATPDPLTGRCSTMRAFVFTDDIRALLGQPAEPTDPIDAERKAIAADLAALASRMRAKATEATQYDWQRSDYLALLDDIIARTRALAIAVERGETGSAVRTPGAHD